MREKTNTLFFAALAVLIFTETLSATYADADNVSSITFVGVDNDNMLIETTIPSRRYQENLKKAVTSINESTLAALNAQKNRKAWSLKVILVGIGANLELGIGSLIKVAALPRFRLLFTNMNDPAIP